LAQQGQQSYLSDPQRLNAYSYAKDNPISQKDPNGRDAYGINLSAVAEGGLGIFAAGTFSIGIAYVRDPNTGQQYISFPVTTGANSGIFGAYQSFPDTGLLPIVFGAYGGLGVSGSYSPNARKPKDLEGDASSLNINLPYVSMSVQGANTNSPTYTGGPGVKGFGSMSLYPVHTVAPGVSFQTIQNAGSSVLSTASNGFQAIVNQIQAQINPIQAQLNAFVAQQSSQSSKH
jgi:hypothetical protein